MLKESPPSPSMMGYSSPLSGFLLEGTSNKSRVSSFHHSDSSWDFDFDSFSDVPVYDEATTPTTPTTPNRTPITTTTSCYMQKLPWEEDTKKKKKKKDNPRELDFNSSWPSARHLLAKTTTTTTSSSNSNKTTKSKAGKNKSKNRGNNNSNSLDSNSNHGPASCSAPSENDSRPARSRGVRFAPTKVVRTHTLVLGDHPMCEDGLALQLGWDFTESRDIIKPLSNANGGGNLPRWRRILRPTAPLGMEGPAKLLSLQERLKLLKEVAGCTDDELEKRRFCARYLSSDYYAFRKPRQQPSTPRNDLPEIPASNTDSNQKTFTNTKNFAAGSSNSTTTNNKNNSKRGSSNGCRDPPPTPTSQQVRAGNETPIARPRRRSLNRRTSQPHYAARMA